MTFGQRIKKLRHEASMTQENLAEILSFSPQAVSRWETNLAMPDISLLPPLANLFHTTTDYLLGMENYQKEKRKAEFDEAFRDYWQHDDKEKNYQIAVRAVAEYPGNMEYVEWLATAEYYVGFPTLDKDLMESSIKHYTLVLSQTKDIQLYDQALNGIVLALHFMGRNEEAKEYAMSQKDEEKQDELLCWCLEGEEKISHNQKVTERLFHKFLSQLYCSDQSIEACTALEQIVGILFPDGNYQYYHNILQYNAIHKAFVLCGEKRFEEVIFELQKAKYHAGEMVKYNKEKQYSFTAPLFHYVKGDKQETDSEVTDMDDFIQCLNNNRCFDILRNRNDFQELYKM